METVDSVHSRQQKPLVIAGFSVMKSTIFQTSSVAWGSFRIVPDEISGRQGKSIVSPSSALHARNITYLNVVDIFLMKELVYISLIVCLTSCNKPNATSQ